MPTETLWKDIPCNVIHDQRRSHTILDNAFVIQCETEAWKESTIPYCLSDILQFLYMYIRLNPPLLLLFVAAVVVLIMMYGV